VINVQNGLCENKRNRVCRNELDPRRLCGNAHGSAVLLEGGARQLLGEKISGHLSSIDVAHGSDATFLAFASVVISEINMLASGAVHRIVRLRNSALAVAEQVHR